MLGNAVDLRHVVTSTVGAWGRRSKRPHRPAWAPVLDGATRDAALAAAEEVAEALAERPVDDPYLAGGSAGRALLHARFADHDPAQRDAALACLRHALPALRSRGGPASLHAGAAGIGWVLDHLGGDLLDERDRGASLDRALLTLLDRRPWPGHFDLITGLTGLGVYALERLDARDGPGLLERVVGHLAELAVRDGDDVYWWTSPEWLVDDARARSPQGRVDCGLAHGVPGPVALLGAACAAGVAVDTSRVLLAGAVGWLLRHGASDGTLLCWRGPDGDPPPARVAWCYGAPGVATALLVAARGAGEPAWEHAARKLARRAAACSVDDSGVVDAGVCHGAAGLGLVFARLHQATGDTELRDAAQFWFAHTLALREPGTGIAGFTADGVNGTIADPGLLTGATGIGLALHAAVTTHEPTWDRALLLSAAPAT